MSTPYYDVREATGNPDHPSVDAVCERLLADARDGGETHADVVMSDILEQYGAECVRTVVRRVLVENSAFRSATHGLEMDATAGAWIGAVAVDILHDMAEVSEI